MDMAMSKSTEIQKCTKCGEENEIVFCQDGILLDEKCYFVETIYQKIKILSLSQLRNLFAFIQVTKKE